MDPITRLLVKLFTPNVDELSPAKKKATLGLLEGYVSLVVNILLSVAKIAIGVLSGSVALLADAVHTLTDCISSGVLIVGAYVARKPADKEHPFGHGRSEHIVSIVIAILLGVTAIEFGKESIFRIMDPKPMQISGLMIAAVIGTMVVKYWNSIFARALAKQSGSGAIEADFWHHMTDVFTTGLALVAIIAANFSIFWLDGVMGVAVSLVLLWVAWEIAKEAASPLMGAAPSDDELVEIKEKSLRIEEVRDIHDVVVHHYGDVRQISLHAEVSDKLSALESHDIAERLQAAIAENEHGSVVVHIDPINDDHPLYDPIRQHLLALIENLPGVDSFHDLRLVGDDRSVAAILDVKVNCAPNDKLRSELTEAFLNHLKLTLPQVQAITLNLEPLFNNAVNTPR